MAAPRTADLDAQGSLPARSRTRTRPAERDVHRLFRRLRREQDPAVRDQVIELHLPLARHVAQRYATDQDRDDVLQVALLGLVKAVDRFDPDRGFAFSSFAVPTMVGEIKRYFRDLGWMVRVPRDLQERVARVRRAGDELSARRGHTPTASEIAEELGESLEDVVEALSSQTAHRPVALEFQSADDMDAPAGRPPSVEETGFAEVETASMVESLLTRVSDAERTALVLRFRHEMLQREIAEHMGVSQMQVSRLLSRALTRLGAEGSAVGENPPSG